MSVPSPLELKDPILDLAFHPTEYMFVVGLGTGHTNFYTYTSSETSSVLSIRPHLKSIRGVDFTPDGTGIYTISRDKSFNLLEISTGTPRWSSPNAHNSPLNALHVLDAHCLATGDESGEVRIWDTRQAPANGPVHLYTEHSDFISAMTSRARTLLVTSGDGHLSVWDTRKPNLVAMSDNQEDELLSICVVKSGQKVAIGSMEGILSLWSWGDWGDMTDRFLGHPESIDSILKLDEDTIATGSTDGIIRIVGLLPNKFHGILGTHGELPVEKIRLAAGGKMLGSCGHDSFVRFWDVGFLFDEEENDEEDEGNETMDKFHKVISKSSSSPDKRDNEDNESENDSEDKSGSKSESEWEDIDNIEFNESDNSDSVNEHTSVRPNPARSTNILSKRKSDSRNISSDNSSNSVGSDTDKGTKKKRHKKGRDIKELGEKKNQNAQNNKFFADLE